MRDRVLAWVVVLSLCAFLLAVPALALAQSAGDTQYRDPLNGGSKPGGGSGNGSDTGTVLLIVVGGLVVVGGATFGARELTRRRRHSDD